VQDEWRGTHINTQRDSSDQHRRRTDLPAAAPAQRLLRQQAAHQAGDLSALAQVLRLDRSTLYRVLGRERLRYDTADRIAVGLGRHPSELWPEWFLAFEQGDR
jgi:lambda repressor-like predicted transcriptional regulator